MWILIHFDVSFLSSYLSYSSNLKWFCVSSCTRQLFPKQFCSTKLKSDTKEKGDKIYDNILVNLKYKFWITDIIIFLDTKTKFVHQQSFLCFCVSYDRKGYLYIILFSKEHLWVFWRGFWGQKERGICRKQNFLSE